jgi:hypothetical protein
MYAPGRINANLMHNGKTALAPYLFHHPNSCGGLPFCHSNKMNLLGAVGGKQKQRNKKHEEVMHNVSLHQI